MSYPHDPLPEPSPKPLGSPASHARKRPNLTITMLKGLREAAESSTGIIWSYRGTGKALERRGLAAWSPKHDRYVITDAGRLLIRTQYDALKQVLPDTRPGHSGLRTQD